MIGFQSQGSFKNMESFLTRMSKFDVMGILNQCGREGVAALASATPVESGRAAQSWDYEIEVKGGRYTIHWINTDVENGFHVVIALQYGHGTGTGGWVEGRDYINPAMLPIFDNLESRIRKAVASV